MVFWLTAIGGVLLVAAGMVVALLRKQDDATVAPMDSDLQVYRDQLKEVERDIARGVLSEEDGARVRVEVSRRILDADKAIQSATAAPGAPKGLTYGALAFTLAVLVGGSLWIYTKIGQPNYPDLPLHKRIETAEEVRKTRPDQAAAEARIPPQPEITNEISPMVAQLREVVKERPDDLQGFTLLAGAEASLGNFAAAYKAQEQVIRLKGAGATAQDHTMMAETMILAAAGYVSPQAEDALNRALQIDPKQPTARFYAGLMFQQVGRPDLAFRLWRDLLAEGPEDAPWIAPIRADIEQLAAWAGVEYTPPAPTTRGPSASDMAAAAEMSPEDRREMIQGMVDGLAERLGTEGGTPAEWAQLINALGQLGQTQRAAAIWAEAQEVFAATPEAVETIRRAAQRVGVAE
ncbi:c-type cytochrome biogenesis protein CcmI [Actibacterium pelagium]|uniref:C-type cytochrome biogenesis protein CcmI n=1 Tax=Actibacterium pelagium TaxID=2029103 RepID=A0A917EHC3_9RHOB|nr:c-type cytochrome biogenesis protein CcmI [Actibacterium pelagium]GGE40062.1 c-type cytochrome biogenesis protein CcmI [Actibacterium pelagium]